MVFYSSRSPPSPTNSISVSEYLQRPRAGVRRGHARFAFLICVYPIDISRLKSGIWRTPPLLLETQKNMWGGIFHVVR